MKALFLPFLILFFITGHALAQNQVRRHVQEVSKIRDHERFTIFNQPSRIRTGFRYHKKKGKGLQAPIQGEGTRVRINPSVFTQLRVRHPDFIAIPLDLPDGPVELELYRVTTSKPVRVFDQKGRLLQVPESQQFRGIVKDAPDSLVHLSLFSSGKVMGFVSVGGQTFDIGNLRPSQTAGRPQVSFDQTKEDLVEESDIVIHDSGNLDPGGKVCDSVAASPTDPRTASTTENQQNLPPTDSQALVASNIRPVRVTLVTDHDLYLKYSSNSTALTNFITGLFNQVATLFASDGISVELAEIKIFTEPDPFASLTSTSGSSGFYNAFSQYMNNLSPRHSGDIAHFITARSLNLGGRASVATVCSGSGYGVNNIFNFYSVAPTYSWSVNVLAHEMGHNLGSQHTHACSWSVAGVTNQAIDGCFNPEGTCTKPAVPTGGGTLMSYCHLSSVGINFSNGLGPLPKERIHNLMNNSYLCLRSTPTPTPSAAPSPGGSPLPSPSPGASPSASPNPSPNASPSGSPSPSPGASPISSPSPSVGSGGGSSALSFEFSDLIRSGKIPSFSIQPLELIFSNQAQVSKVEYFVNNSQICASVPVTGTCTLTILTRSKVYSLRVRVTSSSGATMEKTLTIQGE